MHCALYTVFQKNTHTQTFVYISANYVPSFKICAQLKSTVNLQ